MCTNTNEDQLNSMTKLMRRMSNEQMHAQDTDKHIQTTGLLYTQVHRLTDRFTDLQTAHNHTNATTQDHTRPHTTNSSKCTLMSALV